MYYIAIINKKDKKDSVLYFNGINKEGDTIFTEDKDDRLILPKGQSTQIFYRLLVDRIKNSHTFSGKTVLLCIEDIVIQTDLT